MKISVADLIVEVPETGGMDSRCKGYEYHGKDGADIIIRADLYDSEQYQGMDESLIAYMESGWQFYAKLIKMGGLYLHSSAVEMENKAYLFSGPCGTGKSTHTRLWQSTFGDAAQVFNDDKPAIRKIDGTWYAYGTPWCGKDGINQNKKIPLAGICFLKQAPENKIRRLSSKESIPLFCSQTLFGFPREDILDTFLGNLDDLLKAIPVFEFENRPEEAAARMSFEAMKKAAEEAGL